MEEKMDIILCKLSTMENDIKGIREDVSGLKEDVAALKKNVSSLSIDVEGLKERVQALEFTIDNETNRNIRILAENHIDLHRKMDSVLKGAGERELLLMRMNIMENDMRRVKEHIGLTA